MARFTVRVELHHADDDDYERLHDTMEGAGFTRYIVRNGVRVRLPEAEYSLKRDLTINEVVELAEQAAARTGRRYVVLVTEARARRLVRSGRTR